MQPTYRQTIAWIHRSTSIEVGLFDSTQKGGNYDESPYFIHLLTLQRPSHIPLGEARSSKGEIYTRDAPCPICEGSDRQSKRVSLANFDQLPRHPALRCGRP